MKVELNCQQFDQRAQELLDQRLDPSTDASLIFHAALCQDCHESLLAYSAMYRMALPQTISPSSSAIGADNENPTMVNNGDFPAPLDLAIPDLTEPSFDGRSRQPWKILQAQHRTQRRRSFAIASSIAAMLVVTIILGLANVNDQGGRRIALVDPGFHSPEPFPSLPIDATGDEVRFSHEAYSFDSVSIASSLDEFRSQLQPLNRYYLFSTELPGLRPIRASINFCFDFFQGSIFGSDERPQDESSDFGARIEAPFDLFA